MEEKKGCGNPWPILGWLLVLLIAVPVGVLAIGCLATLVIGAADTPVEEVERTESQEDPR